MNYRDKFIQDYISLIDKNYSHLNDKERNDLIYFKNQKDMKTKDFNRLKDLADKCKVRY